MASHRFLTYRKQNSLIQSYILGTSRNEMETIDIELEMPVVWHSRALRQLSVEVSWDRNLRGKSMLLLYQQLMFSHFFNNN